VSLCPEGGTREGDIEDNGGEQRRKIKPIVLAILRCKPGGV